MITIKGLKYDFRIMPSNDGTVNAQIFRLEKNKYIEGSDFEILIISNQFGVLRSVFNNSPKEKDYLKARLWVDKQLNLMIKANK